jgi:hypothetical protein
MLPAMLTQELQDALLFDDSSEENSNSTDYGSSDEDGNFTDHNYAILMAGPGAGLTKKVVGTSSGFGLDSTCDGAHLLRCFKNWETSWPLLVITSIIAAVFISLLATIFVLTRQGYEKDKSKAEVIAIHAIHIGIKTINLAEKDERLRHSDNLVRHLQRQLHELAKTTDRRSTHSVEGFLSGLDKQIRHSVELGSRLTEATKRRSKSRTTESRKVSWMNKYPICTQDSWDLNEQPSPPPRPMAMLTALRRVPDRDSTPENATSGLLNVAAIIEQRENDENEEVPQGLHGSKMGKNWFSPTTDRENSGVQVWMYNY